MVGCFCCLLIILTGSVRAKHVRLMSWKDYSRQSHSWPYVLNIQTPEGHLLYFGARHTKDPTDPQISEIERSWTEFHPDVALNEGGNPPTEKTRDEAVGKYGEPGLVRFLAARDKVPVQSIDPTRAAEVAELSKTFPAEQLKLFFVLLVVTEYGRVYQGEAKTLEEELRRVFPILAATPGLNGPPNSIPELEATYARYLPYHGTFKDARPSWFDPVKSENFLNQIARRGSEYRNRYMVDLLTREVKDGKRVFAVVGGTHVVMQERAIRSLLGKSTF